MKHEPEKHHGCRIDHCPICDGGLFVCKHCGLFEGSLTTDCPGQQSYRKHGDTVYQGREDFRDGRRVKGCSPHSPEYYRTHEDLK